MKKTLVVLFMALVIFILSGCVRKHCYTGPKLNQIFTINPGDIMFQKVECFGRVTVNECTVPLELFYLGNTRTYIRMGKRSGVSGTMAGSGSSIAIGPRSGVIFGNLSFKASIDLPSLLEFTYPMGSMPIFIDVQGTKLEITDIGDTWIKYRLMNIPTDGCDKVIGQDVN